MPGQRSWLCKLVKEASYYLGWFWYTCWRNCRTISSTPSLTLILTLKVKDQANGLVCVRCPRTPAFFWSNFRTRADVVSGRHPVSSSFTLNLTFNPHPHLLFRHPRPHLSGLVYPLTEIELRDKIEWKDRDILNLTTTDFTTLGHILIFPGQFKQKNVAFLEDQVFFANVFWTKKDKEQR